MSIGKFSWMCTRITVKCKKFWASRGASNRYTLRILHLRVIYGEIVYKLSCGFC